jgi:hypothetical protein
MFGVNVVVAAGTLHRHIFPMTWASSTATSAARSSKRYLDPSARSSLRVRGSMVVQCPIDRLDTTRSAL